jgi:hypothetical protein
MIWTLVRKELLTNLLTLRLTVALIFIVILSVLTTVIGSLDYSQLMDAYSVTAKNIRDELDKDRVYFQVAPDVKEGLTGSLTRLRLLPKRDDGKTLVKDCGALLTPVSHWLPTTGWSRLK